MFKIRNLSVLVYAAGFTMWVYQDSVTISEALQPGFFDSASDMMATGDIILISSADGGAQRFVTGTVNGVVCLAEMA